MFMAIPFVRGKAAFSNKTEFSLSLTHTHTHTKSYRSFMTMTFAIELRKQSLCRTQTVRMRDKVHCISRL